MTTMKLQHLRSLIALVESGSIRGAARSLSLTQPALTARIAELESQIGATLVNRSPYGTTLTPIGRALLEHARLIDNQVQRAEEEIAQLTAQGAGSLAVGVSPLAAIELVAPILAAFQVEHPGVRLRIVEGLFLKVASNLREGSVDLVVAPMPLGRQNPKLFHIEELVTYPSYVVGRAGHPLRGVRRLQELTHADWIVGASTSSKFATVEELFMEHDLPRPNVAVYTDSLTQVQAAISSTDLLGLLPEELFRGWPGIDVRPLDITDTIRPVRVGLMMRAGMPLTPIAEDFTAMIRQRASVVAKGVATRRLHESESVPVP